MYDEMARRVCLALLLGLGLAACSSIAKPSATRSNAFASLRAIPLKLPRPEPGQPCPQARVSQPYRNSGIGLGNGPVYVLSGQLVVSDSAHPQKVVWIADPNYTGPIRIRGGRIDGSGQLLLGGPDNQWRGAPVNRVEGTDLYPELDFLESHTSANPPSTWRTWPSATYISTPGCYAWQVDGLGFTEIISVHAGTYIGSIGQPQCAPAAVFHGGIPEAGFDSPAGSLWMLMFAPLPPAAHQEIKIVWRMTGSGGFTFRATDAGGIESKPLWGPDVHDGSSWAHLGAEVGIGFNFPHAGCWDIHVDRGDTVGDAWLTVA